MVLELYINNVESNSLNNSQNKNKISYKKSGRNFINIDCSQMKLRIGEKNFEGIIGDFFIINEAFQNEDITKLLELNGNYSYIVQNINDQIDLIKNLDYF